MSKTKTALALAPLTSREEDLMKTDIMQKALFEAGNYGAARILRPVIDSAGHIRAEIPLNDDTVSMLDFYGKRYFSRKMLRDLGYTEAGERLILTINSLHLEIVDDTNSQYAGGDQRKITCSFKETGTRLVMNAGNRRDLLGAVKKGAKLSYLSRPHIVELFAGETEDGKGASIMRLVEECTDEMLAKAAKAANSDLFGDDGLEDGQAF